MCKVYTIWTYGEEYMFVWSFIVAWMHACVCCNVPACVLQLQWLTRNGECAVGAELNPTWLICKYSLFLLPQQVSAWAQHMDHIGRVHAGSEWGVWRKLTSIGEWERRQKETGEMVGVEYLRWVGAERRAWLQSCLHQSCNIGSSGPAGPQPEPHSSKHRGWTPSFSHCGSLALGYSALLRWVLSS